MTRSQIFLDHTTGWSWLA